MSLDSSPTFGPTSAAGAMVMRQLYEPILVGLMLVSSGTSSAPPLPVEMVLRSPRVVEQTNAGLSATGADHAGSSIAELRRLTGFTWDQLARIFSVSRRSLHFWASGKSMTANNEEHLQRVLGVVRHVDRGSASANRSILLAVADDGSVPIDLLVEGQYERVVGLLGPGDARRPKSPNVSAAAAAARIPSPPQDLIGALQDRIYPASGRLLAVKAVRVPRRK
jgi:DNA-binding transcriptional regulator YiaG